MRRILFFAILFLSLQSSAQDTLDVISWNVFLRPGILGDHQNERVDSIAAYLNTSNADVLILQETFHRKTRKKLLHSLDKQYPYHSDIGKKSFWGISSGVLIFSKDSIEYDQATYFKKLKKADRLAKKGVHAVIIRRDTTTIKILGTHFQAGGSNKCYRNRKNQIDRKAELDSITPKTNITLYAGDFNTERTESNYAYLLSKLNCVNTEVTGDIVNTANFIDHELTSADGPPCWIDFILLKKNHRVHALKSWIEEPRATYLEEYQRLSDHNVIRTVYHW